MVKLILPNSASPGQESQKCLRKLVHSFGHLAENTVFRHLALIEKLCLWSPRAEREVMKSDREVTKAVH